MNLNQSVEMPQVSICLPTFNGERFIAAAIESVLKQTFTDFELLIIDDCSTDLTAQICARYADSDRRIKFCRNEKNLGLFANYNASMAQAKGDLIKPFAQDDLLHPAYLAKSVETLERFPGAVLVSSERQAIDAEGKAITEEQAEMPMARLFFDPNIETSGLDTINICSFPLINYIGEPSAVMFRRSAIGTGFDTTFNHLGDIEYWLRILTEGNYCFIPQKLCSFRSHKGSASTANTRTLLFAPDMIKFGHKFSWIFDALGRSKEEYMRTAVLSLSDHVHWLKSVGRLDEKEFSHRSQLFEMLEDNVKAGGNDEQNQHNLLDFRELAVYALQALGEQRVGFLIGKENKVEVNFNQIKINSLEQELAALLKSRSWTLTKFFRDMNALLKTGSWSDNENNLSLNAEEVDSLKDQRRYIDYLQKSIRAVIESRSWRYTKSMRFLKRKRTIQIERMQTKKITLSSSCPDYKAKT